MKTLVFPTRRRFQQNRLIISEETRNRSNPGVGGRNSGEGASPRHGRYDYQAPQGEVHASSSTPADTRAKHSALEISTVSIRRRQGAEAAQYDRRARGAAVGRERVVEIRLRRSRSVLSCIRDWSGSETVLKTTEARPLEINGSVDARIGANTIGGQGRSRLSRLRGQTFEDLARRQPRRFATRGTGNRGPDGVLWGVPSWVMKRSEAKRSLDRSTL
ncbi:hypothetical protein F5Y14DRAFT_450767 [Nemania sp. NC0429]|nr:hypothetical protein F5Y14DRAFT_450767 [Nemania sp. NC0429]